MLIFFKIKFFQGVTMWKSNQVWGFQTKGLFNVEKSTLSIQYTIKKSIVFHQLHLSWINSDCCFFPKKPCLMLKNVRQQGCSFCQGVLGFNFYFILPCCPISLSWVDCDFTSKLPKEAHAKNCFKHFFELDTKWILIMWVHLLFCNKSLGGWLRVIIAQVAWFLTPTLK